MKINWNDHLPEGHVLIKDRDRSNPFLITRDEKGQAYMNFCAELKASDFVKEPENIVGFVAGGNKEETLDKLGKHYFSFLESITHTSYDEKKLKMIGDYQALITLPIKGMNLSSYGPDTNHLSGSYAAPDFGDYFKEDLKPEARAFWEKYERIVDRNHTTHGTLLEGAIRALVVEEPKPTIMEALEHQVKAFNLLDGCDRLAQRAEQYVNQLKQNPEALEELQKLFKDNGLKNITFAGTGRSGIFLKAQSSTGEPVAIAIRNFLTDRAKIPHNIQPLLQKMYGGVGIEVLPMLDLKSVTKEKMVHLNEMVGKFSHNNNGFEVTDAVYRNYGANPKSGTVYYLDGDGIHSNSLGENIPVDIGEHAPWISSDGVWKQYEEFQGLHEAFNSPLHQVGGRLIPLTTETNLTVAEKETALNQSTIDHSTLLQNNDLTLPSDSPIVPPVVSKGEPVVSAADESITQLPDNIKQEIKVIGEDINSQFHDKAPPKTGNIQKMIIKNPEVSIGLGAVATVVGGYTLWKGLSPKPKDPNAPEEEKENGGFLSSTIGKALSVLGIALGITVAVVGAKGLRR